MDFLQTLTLAVALSTGYVPDYTRMDGDAFISKQERFYTDIGLELSAMDDLFFVAMSTKTQAIHPEGSTFFSPIHEEYRVGAGMRFGTFEIGYEHYCLHPVETWTNGLVTDRLFGAANTFYAKWSGKFRMFN